MDVKDELEFVVDINPHKHGQFLAGSGHEIVSPEFLREYKPDSVIAIRSRREVLSASDMSGPHITLLL